LNLSSPVSERTKLEASGNKRKKASWLARKPAALRWQKLMETLPFTPTQKHGDAPRTQAVASGYIFRQILRAAQLIMAPGGVYELRVPKAGCLGTLSGYFDNPEALARAAVGLDGLHPGIYITLNPCRPELLARAYNRVVHHAQITTADHDILRRRWLLIDCDPKRPAGISSSDHEHARAITTAYGIWDDLRGAGFPDPVITDSGNGAHLLYGIDLPNNQVTTNLVRDVLLGIAARCGPDDIGIDVAVYNASRICKLYGTLTCKGDSIPDRPHRRSCLLEVPEQVNPIRLAAQ
jgi:hypothetical protein